MQKGLALILLVAAIILGYLGYTTYQEATAGVSVLGFDISMSDQETRQVAIYYGLGAVVCLLASAWLFRR